MNDVITFLSLGTNLEDKWDNLRQAIQGLTAFTIIKAISPVYQTKPWGLTKQPDFLNMCITASTTLPPLCLLKKIKILEESLGRQPTKKWGPRLIDVDILFYDTLIFKSKQLTVPHPYISERAFVLAPLADIAPHLEHPQTGLSIIQMLNTIDVTDAKKLSKPLF